MTSEIVIEYLESYLIKLAKAHRINDHIERARSKIHYTPVIFYGDKLTGTTSDTGARFETLVIDIADSETELKKTVKELNGLEMKLLRYINQVPDSEARRVLKAEFLKGVDVYTLTRNPKILKARNDGIKYLVAIINPDDIPPEILNRAENDRAEWKAYKYNLPLN